MNNDFPTDGPDSVAEVETRPSEVRSDALLGCPFCGGTAALSKNYDGWWHVYCNNCHCKTETYGLPEGPTDAWNRRHARECGYCGHDRNCMECGKAIYQGVLCAECHSKQKARGN